jgi:hypothetical protein
MLIIRNLTNLNYEVHINMTLVKRPGTDGSMPGVNWSGRFGCSQDEADGGLRFAAGAGFVHQGA